MAEKQRTALEEEAKTLREEKLQLQKELEAGRWVS